MSGTRARSACSRSRVRRERAAAQCEAVAAVVPGVVAPWAVVARPATHPAATPTRVTTGPPHHRVVVAAGGEDR